MSAGSTNIVVQITDQVDGSIAPKIREIAAAARDANTYLVALQSAVSSISGGTTKLTAALGQVTPSLNTASTGTNRLTGAFAQLLGRVVGAEAGFGMLGGAIGRVGVAAGIAGPLIIAALAIGAIAGVILGYNKLEESAFKLTEAQIQLNEHTATQVDKLLVLRETLIGLTEGPLAKYEAELSDLSKKEIPDDISKINKVLDDQKSKWAQLISFVQRYGDVVGQALEDAAFNQTTKVQSAFSIQDAKGFLAQNKEIRSELDAEGKGLQGLKNDLASTGAKLVELHNLEQTESGRTLSITEVARKAIQQHYKDLLKELDIYNAEKAIKEKEASGQTLAEQRRLSEQELRQFNTDLAKLRDSQGLVSPQQTLQVRQKQLSQFDTEHPGDQNQSSPFAGTRDSLVKDIGNAQQAIDRQTHSLDDLITKYKNETLASGAYSIALKTEVEQRTAALAVEKIKPGGDAFTIAELNLAIQLKHKDAETAKEQIAIYNQFQGPIEKYNAVLAASSRLLKDGAISSNQAAIADATAARAKQDSLNPLNEYSIGLEHEVALLGIYGTALTVATEVDRVRQGLQKEGRDLTVQENTELTKFLTNLERQKQLQSEINNLYQSNAGNIQKLVIQQTALNSAQQKGIISETQYRIATAQVNIALANQALLEGKSATLQNQIVAGFGKYIAGYQGLAKGISDAYGQAFTTIADGAANSLGRAIAYGENLGDALKNVARQAVSELISAFIKLGIQWVITEVIGQTVGATAAAATVGLAASISAAWAPAAAFASLASFGANAAPAAAAVSGTVALSEALALVGAHKAGGFISGPGTGTSDSILGRLSNGEYIVNAAATARNRDELDAINSGTSLVKSNSRSVGSGSNNKLEVNVIHDGSTAIAVEQLSDDRIRIIAKQEARTAVSTHAPSVIASDLQNPNSRTSKAITQNVETKRRR